MENELKIPKVWSWRSHERFINCNSIIEVADWAKRFSYYNPLDNDVKLPLERCVIASYQIGYLFDYLQISDKKARMSYFEEGICSVLFHSICTYEMMGRETIKLNCMGFNPKMLWSGFDFKESLDVNHCLNCLSEQMFKFQRWVLYHHMNRIRRWDEEKFKDSLDSLIQFGMGILCKEKCNIERGFALTMSKLQDGEIKRH